MDYLPVAVTDWLEGRIDPTSQRLIEQYSQYYFIVLVAISFILSLSLQSVLIGLEAFMAGLVLLLLATVPTWPYLNKHPIKFLPARQPTMPVEKQ